MFSRVAISSACVALSAAVLCGCGGSSHGVGGTVSDAKPGSKLVLEQMNGFGAWMPVDSVAIGSDGEFFMPYDVPLSQELYRLGLNGDYVYLPVDTVADERLTLKASAKNFSGSFELSGSQQAEAMTAFERDVRRVEALANPDSTEALRLRVFDRYIHDSKADNMSYYVLMRHYGDGFLIDYTDPIYAAVANVYQCYRPNDPRTASLVARAKEGQAARRKARGYASVVEAPQVGYIDIEAKDVKGQTVALSSHLGKGKPVVVVFTALTAKGAPEINMALRSLYEKGAADIYMLCLDSDQYSWQRAAEGLPWCVVRDSQGAQSINLTNYNVGSLPAFFIYDGKGDLRDSAGNVDGVKTALQKL